MELANGKVIKLGRLRGFARVVIATGSAADVAAAVAAAEPHKEALLERGVMIVPFASGPDSDALALPPSAAPPGATPERVAAEARWRAKPLFASEWSRWLDDQTGQAKLEAGSQVYVSLRMDGRVRASGRGQPPWELLAASLPPTSGLFAGFLDGMDGRVGEN